MFRLSNLPLIGRAFFFIALMIALALAAVRGQAGQRPADVPAPVLAGNGTDELAGENLLEVVPGRGQPAASESVAGPPFRITAEGELQKWAASEWVTITGLPSRATALAAVSEATMYVGTEALGVFKSTDAGNTWRAVNNAGLGLVPGSVLDITALAVDPAKADHVFAATAYLFGSTRCRLASTRATTAARPGTRCSMAGCQAPSPGSGLTRPRQV